MKPLRKQIILIGGAFAGIFLAAGCAAVVIGTSRVVQVLFAERPAWILLLAGAQLLAYLAYTLSYRPLFGLRLSEAARRACYGFSPLASRGGFYYDALAVGHSSGKHKARVLSLAEMLVLTPAICGAGWYAWMAGLRIPATLTVPWAIGVPAGMVLVLLFIRVPVRLTRPLLRRLEALLAELTGLTHRQWAVLLAGMGLYWTGEVASLYAALHLFGVAIGLPALIIGYSTGYVLSRRSLPAAYIWLPTVLMLFALHWVGVSYAAGLLATYSYLFVSLVPPLLYLAFHHKAAARAMLNPQRTPPAA